MSYGARPVRRTRATKAEMAGRREVIAAIVHGGAPMAVRHAFYAAVGAGIGIPKTRAGYSKVQRLVLELRREGVIDYNEITDGTRYVRQSDQWDGLDEALGDIWRTYRRNLWADSDYDIEVWCESDSIGGTLWPIVDEWGLPLHVTRGYASETFLYQSARSGATHILYIGDLDPHGENIESDAQRRLSTFGSGAEWERVALTREQVAQYSLLSSYGGHGVEAEAMPAETMRGLLRSAIELFVDASAVAVIRAVEEEERLGLRRLRNHQVMLGNTEGEE
jgi:hypothetical protein